MLLLAESLLKELSQQIYGRYTLVKEQM